MEQYIITGMSCAACQARVEKAVSALEGVDSCSVSLLTNSMGVEGSATPDKIIKAVEDAGYGAAIKGQNANNEEEDYIKAEAEALIDRETPVLKKRLIWSVVFLVLLMYITMGHHMLHLPLPAYFMGNYAALAVTQMLLAIIVMFINQKFFVGGFSSLIHGSPNMDTLVALGSSVSFGWSFYVLYDILGALTAGVDAITISDIYYHSLYFESAAMIPALITVGKMLEAISKGRTTDALKNLMKLAPQTAVVIRNDKEVEVDIKDVSVGDIFVVRSGSSVPVDGIILEGQGAFDESALTGESIPVDRTVGDTVSSATINKSGFVQCRATRVGRDTSLAQIIHMVSDAAATKAPIARIADRVSAVFVPTVIAIAVLVYLGWIMAGADIASALERAICVLVISCPCALGLATPVAIMVGNGIGAKGGILFKTGEALELAGRTNVVALDKTGTITTGKPEVTDVMPAPGLGKSELLALAYALEVKSEHPLAQAITEYAVSKKLPLYESKDFMTLAGSGVEALILSRRSGEPVDPDREVSSIKLHCGSASFIQGFTEIDDMFTEAGQKLAEEGKTPIYFEGDGDLIGIIAVADAVKPDSKEAIKQLHDLGAKVVMISGDNERTANAIAAQLDIDKVIAGVLPDGKVKAIKEMNSCNTVAMVGDGINDAPALVSADIGIAIGAGTDVAIDSADIVLMNSSLLDVAAAIRLGKAVLNNIHQNLFWAFFYNVICIPLAAGLFVWRMNPMIGAAAMSLSSFTVCMNALRLNLLNIRDASGDVKKKSKTLEAMIDHAPQAFENSADDSIIAEDTLQTDNTIPDIPADNTMHDMHHDIQATESDLLIIDDMLTKLENRGAVNAALKKPDTDPEEEDESDTNDETNSSPLDAAVSIIEEERSNTMEKTVKIEGMMCGHCEANVKGALEGLDGVVSAVVSHESGTAVLTLDGDVSEDVIKTTIEEKGYKFTGME